MNVFEINFGGQIRPFSLSVEALFYFADKVGLKVSQVLSALQNGTMSEYKAIWLFYSGMKYGALERGQEFDMEFLAFHRELMKDEKTMKTFGDVFRKQIELLASEYSEPEVPKKTKARGVRKSP